MKILTIAMNASSPDTKAQKNLLRLASGDVA